MIFVLVEFDDQQCNFTLTHFSSDEMLAGNRDLFSLLFGLKQRVVRVHLSHFDGGIFMWQPEV